MSAIKQTIERVWAAYGAYLFLSLATLCVLFFSLSCARVFNVSQPRSVSSGNNQRVSENDKNMDIPAICATVKRVCAEKGL